MTVGTIAAVVLGLTFGGASVAKLKAKTRFRALLRALLPDAFVRPIAWAVPALEAVLAVMLLSGVAATATLAASAALLIVFSVTLGVMWRQGLSQDCGCFGEASAASTPVSGLVRNMALLALLFAALIDSTSTTWYDSTPRAAVHLVLALAVPTAWALMVAIVVRRSLIFEGRTE